MSSKERDIVSLHQENLQRAIDFLKFAEAKNGAAIAFASALILAALQMREELSDFRLYEITSMLLALAAGLVSARSFLPILSWKSTKKDKNEHNSNLLFFADIAKMTAEDFQSNFAKFANSESDLVHDLSVQTVANSRIATDKMNHFSIAALLLAAGMFLLSWSIVFEFFSRF